MPPRGRPFEKGNCANPNGRPKKGNSITELIEKNLSKDDFAKELIRRAMGGWVDGPDGKREYVKGSDDLLRYLNDRIDGKPRQALDITTEEDLPPIVVEVAKDE